MTASAKKISRNSPCPCGSGLKYKHCCVDKRAAPAVPGKAAAKPRGKGSILFASIIVFALATLVAAEYMERRDASPADGSDKLAALAAEPAATPQPWEYDFANNRHWHAPHGHWHPGAPPPENEREQVPAAAATPEISAANSTPAPQPWEYNAQTNRHWHAPHGHWHDGPPPPKDQRQAAPISPAINAGK